MVEDIGPLTCPGCGSLPVFLLGETAICGEEERRCRVLFWQVTGLPERFKAQAEAIDLPLARNVEQPDEIHDGRSE